MYLNILYILYDFAVYIVIYFVCNSFFIKLRIKQFLPSLQLQDFSVISVIFALMESVLDCSWSSYHLTPGIACVKVLTLQSIHA